MPVRKPPRRFGTYAAMEAGNVLLVPGLALWLTRPTSLLDAASLVPPILAVAGFLIIGALYWRGMDQRFRGRGVSAQQRALRLADHAEKPLLAVLLLAIVVTCAAGVTRGVDKIVIAAAVLTLLAGLEYVNYYHRQLQHFDNISDFKRLLSGRGLRRAHMARDLALLRRR